jgi:hypothetical protein
MDFGCLARVGWVSCQPDASRALIAVRSSGACALHEAGAAATRPSRPSRSPIARALIAVMSSVARVLHRIRGLGRFAELVWGRLRTPKT